MSYNHAPASGLARWRPLFAILAMIGLASCGDAPTTSRTATLSAAVSTKFAAGARVQVVNGTLNVRATPSVNGTLLGTQVVGNLGTIVGGPVYDSTGDQLWRWNVNFDQGADGWAAEYYLTQVGSVPPPSPAPVATVTVSPSTVSGSVGQTAQLTATLKDSTGTVLTGRTITWSSSNTAIAGVSASGLVTASGAGTAAITATSESKTGSATVTVTAGSPPPPVSTKFAIGDRVQVVNGTLNVRATPSINGTLLGTQVVGNLGTVVGGPILDTNGDKMVRWNVNFDQGADGWAAEYYLTKSSSSPPPSPAPVASVTVSPSAPTVAVGSTAQIAATTKDSAGTVLTGRSITWSTSNATIATVGSTGMVSGLAAGSATITATSEGKSGTASITVATVAVASVVVSPASASVPAGQSVQLTATPKDAGGNTLTGRAIVWTTANSAVASVSGTGLVAAVAAGSTTITATSEGKSGTAAVTVTAPPPSGGSQFGHVFIVVEENTDYASVIGTSAMPYLSSLASQYGLATQYYANTHPSIGNYLELVTGQIITNNDSYTGTVSVDNVIRHLNAAGKTWKDYAENLPSPGYLGLGENGTYASRHNPLVYLSDVRTDANVASKVVPFSQLAADMTNNALPQYGFIAPNLCDDAHDCSLGTADNWLRNNIAPLIANPTFQQNGLLIIVFDESGGDNTNGGGRVVWVAVSPKSKRGYQSTTLYQHQSTLRLMLEGLGITSLPGAAASAPSMGEFFTP